MTNRKRPKRPKPKSPFRKKPATTLAKPAPSTDLPITRPRFAFIQTCMGRLAHVQESSKVLLSDPRIDGLNNHYVLVDYFCPEKTGAWASEEYGDRVHVTNFEALMPRLDNREILFNKPIALNRGAVDAINVLGANYLVFLDSDTLVTPELLSFVFQNASPERFLIFEPDHDKRDLTGFLVVHKNPFMRIDGFDKNYLGWGAEDLDLRLRLYLQGLCPLNEPRLVLKDAPRYTMPWTEMPVHLASSIPHEDDKRVAHYKEKDKDASHTQNLDLLCKNVFELLGRHPIKLHESPLGPSMRRLLGMDANVNPKSL